MLIRLFIAILVILLGYNQINKYIQWRKNSNWQPVDRGDLLCTFTNYEFLPEEGKVQVYGIVIQQNNTLQICHKFTDASPLLKYYRLVNMSHHVENHLASHYPLNVPFNCTVDYECKKFRLLSLPPGLDFLKLGEKFKNAILSLLLVTLICNFCYFPNSGAIYLSLLLITLYLLRSYHQYTIVSSPNFTFQFFSKGHLIEL